MHDAAKPVLDELLAVQLAAVPASARDALKAQLSWQELPAGDTLMQQGDPADFMAWLVSGRLQVQVDGRVVRELGRGAAIGEIALFTDEPRSATVRAVRDSLLVRLPRPAFDALAHAHPPLSALLARQLVQRLRSEHRTPAWAPPRTVALVGADARTWAAGLHAALAEHGSVAMLCQGEDPQTLPALEAGHRFVLLVADADGSWRDWCLHHADEQLLLVDARQPATSASLPPAGLAAQTLLLLHAADTVCPQASGAWIDALPHAQWLHLRQNNAADLARLARHLARRSIGLVLAGGGARGFAHLGVLRALQEAGIPVDAVGGTSMGSAMAVLVASQQPAAALEPVVERAFRGNPTGDFNWLPLISLIRGQRLRRALRETVTRLFGHAATIEDLWVPTYVVATNYARASEAVLRRGDLQRAVAASTAIPGALPPVVLNGELHCDGGSFNNLPLDVMRAQRGIGVVIGVDLLAQPVRTVDYADVPGPGALLWDRLLRRRRYRLPSLVAYLLNATILYSHARKSRDAELADLLLQPELARVGLLQWGRRRQIIQQGYEHARQRLAQTGVRDRLLGKEPS